MENQLDLLLKKLLNSYPNALGVTFHSMDLPIVKSKGSHSDILEKYKDIPMMSIDDSFNTTFTYIITKNGTIVIFFVRKLHFVSVFVQSESPNKELANNVFNEFKPEFEELIDRLYAAQ